MGMIRQVTYTVNHLELTLEDIEKQRQRRNTFPKPTPDIVAFCKRLNPCPITQRNLEAIGGIARL